MSTDTENRKLFMVFDVESIGLHGEGFQVGFVVVDETGKEMCASIYQCDPDEAMGLDRNRDWVHENVSLGGPFMRSPRDVRESFWRDWEDWKSKGATLWADCVWPVEANFLSACVNDAGSDKREYAGPYPCYDVMTLRYAAGYDPHATCERLESELPRHDALADARQSARLLTEARERLSLMTPPATSERGEGG